MVQISFLSSGAAWLSHASTFRRWAAMSVLPHPC